MARGIPVRDDYSAADLRAFARRSRDAGQARRLIATGAFDLADDQQVGNFLLGALAATPQVTVLAFVPWLKAEVTGSRIYVRSTPSNRHSGQGWECRLLLRVVGHLPWR